MVWLEMAPPDPKPKKIDPVAPPPIARLPLKVVLLTVARPWLVEPPNTVEWLIVAVAAVLTYKVPPRPGPPMPPGPPAPPWATFSLKLVSETFRVDRDKTAMAPPAPLPALTVALPGPPLAWLLSKKPFVTVSVPRIVTT